ncbi:MAG TPA: hypothetical protein VK591_12720 [Xanthobacteraceae bacterium]|nr:hypothetical protein [Xanthobacteraceae bacterium]
MAKIIVALVLLLGATSAALAQSQSGGNFGTPYSGTAGARNGGHYNSHARSHDSGGQSARGNGGGGGGGEIDARDASTPVAHQASTPQR